MEIAVLGIKRIPAVAGADRMVELMLDHATPGFTYTVYVVQNGAAPRSSGPHVRYVEIPALKGKHAGAASFFLLSSLHAAVVGRYDVAHVHNSDFGAFCLILRMRPGLRLVGTFHGDPYLRTKWGRCARAALRFSETCFVRSCDVLTSVTPTKTVDGRVVQYIPNGAQPWASSDVRRRQVLEALGVDAGQFIMFACGRLDRTKGLHHVLAAYRDLDDAPPLIAVGDFSHDQGYSAEIEAAARRDPRARLLKRLLPRDELFEAVSSAKVFVFPSELEGMSMMLLEAISAGATVVCSDIPENRAVVGDGYPLLFSSGDPRSLARVLKEVIASPDQPDAVSVVRKMVATRFRWDAAAAQYASLYLIAKQSRPNAIRRLVTAGRPGR